MELAEGGDLLTYLRHGKLRHEQYVSVGPDGTLREQQALMVTDHSELMLFVWHIAKGMCHLESVKVRTAALMVTDHSELMLFVWHIAKGMCHLESVKVRTAEADGYGSFRGV